MKKLLLLSLASFCTCMSAAGQVTLLHKFRESEKISYRTELKMTQTLSVGGNDIATANEQTVVVTMNTGKRDKDGNLPADCALTHLKTRLSLPGDIEVKYDSKEPEKAQADPRLEMIIKALRASAALEYRMVYDRDNRVLTVTGSESMLKDLDPLTAAMVKDQVDPEYLKQAANQELDQIPREPLKKGDKWQRTKNVRLGSGQTMAITSEYEYMGPVQHKGKMLHKIVGMARDVTYEQDPAAAGFFKVISSDLGIETLEGAMFFDLDAGRVCESYNNMKITGNLKILAEGKEESCNLALTIRADSTTR